MGAETLTLHSGSGPRKPLGGRESRGPPDRDEDKYRRRPPLAWLPPALRCRARGPRPPAGAGAGRGRGLRRPPPPPGEPGAGGRGDPALEPLHNPHLRVGH
ncbi:zinc finger protein-like 1 [Ciconia boyciana]|uniref:zinc finger protein-like 1 n=1 Tax=Ciconia boyciana TaxID=52775 RepID=UPI003BA2661F